ncbi:hypothetical protein [Nonomuraea sp. NPDC050783]|uniref:hypothetical protein n=1 Tax=Nonomuraea sp. NPDC050783 TaxID=3154634 RepID=UPI003467DA40
MSDRDPSPPLPDGPHSSDGPRSSDGPCSSDCPRRPECSRFLDGLRFPDPARRAAVAAAARAEGVCVEEFVLEAAYQRALRVHERRAPSRREPEDARPRWLQGTYGVSHHY